MKALLASTIFTKIPGGIELAEKMIGKPRAQINVAIINEAAAVEFGDHRWAVDTMKNLADAFGGIIEIVHLMAVSKEQIRERLNAADMIFVLGGNTDWLKIVFAQTGVSEFLPEILQNKLYAGSSAGSMILGHQPSYKRQEKIYGAYDDFGVKSYLDLLDFSILPHCFDVKHPNRNDLAMAESKAVEYPVYALSDNAAVVVDGDKISIIGDDYLKLVHGKAV